MAKWSDNLSMCLYVNLNGNYVFSIFRAFFCGLRNMRNKIGEFLDWIMLERRTRESRLSYWEKFIKYVYRKYVYIWGFSLSLGVFLFCLHYELFGNFSIENMSKTRSSAVYAYR